MGDFVCFFFFVIFRISGIQGFLGSVPPPWDRNSRAKWGWICEVQYEPQSENRKKR